MKQIVSNYSYSPATNVVTLTGVNIDADQLLLIVAPGVGRTMYNFASVTGVVSAGADTRVTLNASTSGLTTTSPLVIFYDDQASTQTVAGTVTANVSALNIDTGISGSALFGVSGQDVNAVRAVIYSSANSDFGNDQGAPVDSSNPLPVTGAVAVNGSVTASSNLNAFAEGTFQRVGGYPIGSEGTARLSLEVNGPAGVGLPSVSGIPAVPIAGTVTVSNSVTIGSLPAISGTVTANASNGSLTTRFGTPTTANTAFATSCVTNANRKYLLIQNVTTGSNVITVGIGFTPTTTQGIQLTAGAGITFESSYIPTGAVYVLSSVTASNFTILEA